MVDVEQNERDISDSLSETTRKERRALLGVSAVLIAMVAGNLTPTNISTLGISLNVGQQTTLLLLLAVLDGYFFYAFLSYAQADIVAWEADSSAFKKRYVQRRVEEEQEVGRLLEDSDEAEAVARLAFMWEHKRSAYRRRKFFDFGVPLVISAAAIALTLIKIFL